MTKLIELANDGQFSCTIEIPAMFETLPKQSLVSLFALVYKYPELNEEAGRVIPEVMANWRRTEENKAEPDEKILRRITRVEKWWKDAANKKNWSIWNNKRW